MIDEKYLKETIDWKFFNYLKDKATKFEDDGCEFTIYVDAKIGVPLFQYQTNKGEKYFRHNFSNIDIDNTIYVYEIFCNHINSVSQYLKLIHDKCVLQLHRACTIIVMPKNNTTND